MAARGQNHENRKNKQAYAPKLKIPPPPKREDPAKDSICHEYGETGHWRKNCPQYLVELLKKKKNAASRVGGSGIFVIELNTILNRSWIYDTSCGTQICNTTQGLRASRKLKPRALSLYVGNGQREAVEVMGAIHLCLPSGLEIVLNNCYYAPSITRGVIYVSYLYEDGFINCFVNNTIQVSRNNMVYFSSILRDGIFEIDLSNSHTNESFIYAVSNKRAKLDLDSALLWHCHLGHISKKRIEKLQHDGLLDSSDLMSFEKCVYCMFGKMARKPYTYQVERAKDLLGLIHTDDYALEPAAHILNMVPTNMVEKTPYEVWHGKAPKLSYLKVWGCEALVKRDTLTKPNKLKPRSVKCIFIVYPKETMGYSFYYPPENKVLVTRNAEFLEISLINQEASRSLEDPEIIQEEDTHPSIDTSLNHEEDDLEIDEPQSDIVPICKSTRTGHAPDRMCLYIDAEEHELGDLGEPANHKDALLDPESKKLLNAMNVEMQSMKENEVLVLVELPPNGKTVGSKWLFKKKTDMDGVVHTYKALADTRAIRILIAIAAYYDYEIWQMDVKIVFLNGYLNEKVYMEQPEGFVNPKYPNRRFCMENSNRGSIPMQEKLKLSKSHGAAELKRMQNIPYASAIGSIMYVVRCIRPDVTFAQNVTSRFQQNLGDLYWTTVKNILKYLRNTKDMFLVYGGDLKRELGVSCYTDSAKQSIFATLSVEAEYIAAFDASKEAVWVRKFISGLGITKGARHFRAKVHYLRLVIEYGDIKLEKVHTDDKLADHFTKALAFPKHSEHTKNIRMLPASRLM
nr:retrotransposon protein, putative, Ty1-copia subclass [Tanacetum cinerariifolium]